MSDFISLSIEYNNSPLTILYSQFSLVIYYRLPYLDYLFNNIWFTRLMVNLISLLIRLLLNCNIVFISSS